MLSRAEDPDAWALAAAMATSWVPFLPSRPAAPSTSSRTCGSATTRRAAEQVPGPREGQVAVVAGAAADVTGGR